MGFISQHVGSFQPQVNNFIDNRFVVVFVIVVTSFNIAFEKILAEIAVIGISDKRYQAGLLQCKDPFAFQSLLFGCFGSCSND